MQIFLLFHSTRRPSLMSSMLTCHFLAFLLFAFLLGGTTPTFSAEETPRIVDQVSIQHYESGIAYGYTLPVYEIGHVRFLSGGVGLKEREATYPPFSVKLILSQQPHVFLAHVSLHIQDEQGQTVIHIPHDLTTGPWVFINLPPGRYHITAENRDGIRIERSIRVQAGMTNTHHFIWPKR